jgi:hypothetical protein
VDGKVADAVLGRFQKDTWVGEVKRIRGKKPLLTNARVSKARTVRAFIGALETSMDRPCDRKHRAEARLSRRTCQGRWSQR